MPWGRGATNPAGGNGGLVARPAGWLTGPGRCTGPCWAGLVNHVPETDPGPPVFPCCWNTTHRVPVSTVQRHKMLREDGNTMDTRVVGIYDAGGGPLGEIRYAARKISGRGSCSLCDATHGWNPRGRPAWRRACTDHGLEIELIHRDDASAAQMDAAVSLPAVIAGDDDRWHRLLDQDDIAALAHAPDALAARIVEVVPR